jgi:NTP pyrophosphatase (non-canonical NTP hydrolase)
MTVDIESVLRFIRYERGLQDAKWGVQDHPLMTWLGILAEEFGEAAKEINEFHFRDGNIGNMRDELVQTAAVAVAMIEYIDRHTDQELKENEKR